MTDFDPEGTQDLEDTMSDLSGRTTIVVGTLGSPPSRTRLSYQCGHRPRGEPGGG